MVVILMLSENLKKDGVLDQESGALPMSVKQ